MTVVLVLASCGTLVFFLAVILTSPRWVARSAHRHRLWRLRDRLVQDVADGALPVDAPPVQQLFARLNWAITNYSSLTLANMLLFRHFRHQLSSEATRVRNEVLMDCPLDGLSHEQCEIVGDYRERLVLLVTGATLLGSWLGLLTVLRGIPAARRQIRQQQYPLTESRYRTEPMSRTSITTATDNAVRRSKLGIVTFESAENLVLTH